MNHNHWILTILFFLFISSFHHFAAQYPPPYTPLQHISLDCGSAADTTTVDGRTWSADTKSTLLHKNTPSTTSSPLKLPTTVDTSLYATARLSDSQFSYTFPVIPGPKFLRLFFYPATYTPNFNPSTSFFSVTANRYTLLSNFSAMLHLQSEKEVYIREFCLVVEDGQSLNLTFTPTQEIPDAYAFINGIEIVSLPDFLYYSSPDDEGPIFAGQGGGNLPLKPSTALELMYRISVASKSIQPENDTGVFRSWEQDDVYLTDARFSSVLRDLTLPLKYSNPRARVAAPDLVYQTARGMGPNKTVNEGYNLTWEFPVDSGFTYLVRLHFCQFDQTMTKEADLVFDIYINGELVAPDADLALWGGYGVPVFRDYGVTIVAGKGDQRVNNLSIALHPSVGNTKYSDAILNGVEIFKMNSSSGNLNATNPDRQFPIIPSASPSSTSPKRRIKTGLIVLLLGPIAGLLALSVLLFLIIRRRRRRGDKDTGSNSKWGPSTTPSSTNKSTTGKSSLPSNRCRYFSLSEIRAATRDFDKDFIIGSGGFGNVFKGLIDCDGSTTSVAIKRLKPESGQGAKEFMTEIEMLSKLRHHNLVPLIGCCNEGDEMILVYEYMSHGTFRDHLYKSSNDPLTWKQRLQICIGAAKGLEYLHTGVEHMIIHRDVKTTNILLDEKWVAKVSDFGMSKTTTSSHVSTSVKGSVGYFDPEYFRLRQITEKSDVYSFGVVLWEVLCAKPAVIHSPGEKPVSLVELARKSYRKGTVIDIVDRHLVGKVSPDSLNKFVEIAIRCLQENGTDRPSMNDVVCFLELALKSQESAVQATASDGGEEEEIPLKWSEVGGQEDNDDSDMFSSINGIAVNSRISGFTNGTTTTGNSDDQSYVTIDDSAEMRSGAVFSEIWNSKGR